MSNNVVLRVLYSRTQFWFGLKAGGSVAHSIGVITEISKKSNLEIIGNEKIYGTDSVPFTLVRPYTTKFLPSSYKELLYNFRYKNHLINKCKIFKPTFIYHRYSGFSFSTASVCKQLKIPLVLEFNSSDVWKMKYWSDRENILRKSHNWFLRQVVNRIEMYNLFNSDLMVVVSEPLKTQLEDIGIPSNSILVNPNGVDTTKFKSGNKISILRLKKKLAIPSNLIVIGFASTFGQWHGIPEMTEAIKRLNNDPHIKDRVYFALFGEGIYRHEMQFQLSDYHNVLFTGTIEFNYIQDYLDICDILISPHGKTPDGKSFFGSPTKLFEYMAMAKGIVASNLGQIGDVLCHKENSYLVEPGNVEQLLSGMKYFIDNQDEVDRLGANARQTVLKSFTWEKNVERLITAFFNSRNNRESLDT